MFSEEEQFAHAEKLAAIRREKSHNIVDNARFVKEMTLGGGISLLRYLNPFIDWLYGVALALAILKDILDFTGLGSLPVIGTVITLLVSFFIFMVMFLTGSGAKRKLIRYGILAGGALGELVFGIDFLPIETLLVILVFRMTLLERRLKAREEKRIAAQTQESFA